MPKSLLNPLTSPKLTNSGKRVQQMHTSSTPTLMGNQLQTPSLSHANLPYLTSLNLRSRSRRSTFGIGKKKEKESSKPMPNNSERWEDALDRTKATSTNLETSSTSPNHLLHYGLCSKICLPAQYLSIMQIELGNYDGNSTWFSNYLPGPKPTSRMPSCEEQMQFKPLNAFKWTPIPSVTQPTDMVSKTSASWNQSKQSEMSTGQTLSKSLKMGKSLNTKDVCQETSLSDTLSQLVQTSVLCPELGNTLTQFLHAAPD
jgi:hypothetical protein